MVSFEMIYIVSKLFFVHLLCLTESATKFSNLHIYRNESRDFTNMFVIPKNTWGYGRILARLHYFW